MIYSSDDLALKFGYYTDVKGKIRRESQSRSIYYPPSPQDGHSIAKAAHLANAHSS